MFSRLSRSTSTRSKQTESASCALGGRSFFTTKSSPLVSVKSYDEMLELA